MKKTESIPKRIVIGAAVCFTTAAIVLMAAAGLTAAGTLPEVFMKPVVTVACALASFIGAFTALHGKASDRLLTALGQGGLCAAVALTAALIFSGDKGPDSFIFTVLGTLLIPALIIGISTKGKRKRRK